jgi:predicted nuclease with RNAse H fold
VGEAALRHGRVFETYPDAIFCSLLGHRPSPKRTPWGLQQRIAALKQRGVVDQDGGLWHRTLDELDACAAAYTAYALAAGYGTWVGDVEEGVIVLPAPELLARYDKLPPPARSPLVG